ncbi:MAG: hypothetical protein ACOYJG_03785 [Prevotella sp.]
MEIKHVSLEANIEPMTVECNNALDANAYVYNFRGCFQKTPMKSYSYYMSSSPVTDAAGTTHDEGGLVRVAPKDGTSETAGKMKAFNAWLEPKASTSEAKYMFLNGWTINDNDENAMPTGIDQIIEDINTETSAHVDGVYTLKGEKVRNDNNTFGLPTGIYICQGKKIVVK